MVIGSEIEAHLRQYVERHRTTRWGIFSDYVIGDRDRPSDSFVFTVAPLGMHLNGLFELALGKSTPDLKDVKTIPDEMHGLLNDARFYSFCFSLRKGDRLPFDRKTIERGIRDFVQGLRAAGGKSAEFAKNFSEVVSKVGANSFSAKLFSDIVFTAAIVSYLIRDRITGSYGELIKQLIALEVPATCSQQFDGWRGPEVGANKLQTGQLWCDGILRVPDYLAGTLSVLCFETDTICTDADKFVEMLRNVMAGHRSIRVFRAALSPMVSVREMIVNPLPT